MFWPLIQWEASRFSRALEEIDGKIGKRRPTRMMTRQKSPDAQVEAFMAEVEREGNAYVMDANNGEFIIDGVVNVRAALDAALSAVCKHVFVAVQSSPIGIAKARCRDCGFEPNAERITHHEPGEFGEGAAVRAVRSATEAKDADHG